MIEALRSCKVCGTTFSRPPDYSHVQWLNRAYCSGRCSEEQKRRVRIEKHRCKDCGGNGPFNTYKTTSGRLSRHSRCKECQNAARRPKRKTEEQRKKENAYSRNFRDRVKLTEPHRIAHSKAWASKNPEKYLFFRMKCGFAKDGERRACKITFDKFLREIGGAVPKVCPVLGIELSFDLSPKSDGLPTVDRIDSSKSYEVGNIAIISWRANVIKNMGTAEEHRRIADWMDRQIGGPSA